MPTYSHKGSTKAKLAELRETIRVPVGLQVQVFLQGKLRRGIVQGLAAKRTYNREEPYVIIEVPELKGTIHASTMIPLRQVKEDLGWQGRAYI